MDSCDISGFLSFVLTNTYVRAIIYIGLNSISAFKGYVGSGAAYSVEVIFACRGYWYAVL